MRLIGLGLAASLWLPAVQQAWAGPKRSIVNQGKREAAKQDAPPPIPEAIRNLGPLSVGHPHAGFLVNGAKLPLSEDYISTIPSHGFGTTETIEALRLCIGKVRAQIPDSPKVMLGSLSAERGGLLPPHKSHRTGRDVDVYFFRNPGAQWSKAATEDDIDLPRTWALLRCFVTETDVDMILVDHKVQGWLEAYALSIGEAPGWVHTLFHDDGTSKTAIVRHVPGHVAHMHVRFASPKARRAAVRNYDRLVAANVLSIEQRAVVHVVAKGDTLSALAVRHNLPVAKIQELNQLSTTLIRIGQKLTLQKPVEVRGARDGVFVRARHLPPNVELKASEPSREAPHKPSEPAVVPPGPPPRDREAASPSVAPKKRSG